MTRNVADHLLLRIYYQNISFPLGQQPKPEQRDYAVVTAGRISDTSTHCVG
jgi:hypothetical protein